MKCEVDFCIYQKNGECIVNEIQINSRGMCDECIIVCIDNNYLVNAKRNQLEDIQSRC